MRPADRARTTATRPSSDQPDADHDQPRTTVDDGVQQPPVGEQDHAHDIEPEPQREVGPVPVLRGRDPQQQLAGEDGREEEQKERRPWELGQPAEQARADGAPQRAKQRQAEDGIGEQEGDEPQVHAVIAEPA